MKISKFKALTITTTLIGSVSLASIAGLTAVAVIQNQSSENQNYSQNDNGENNKSSLLTLAEAKKLFTNKRTIQPNEKVFEALNQIKTINDLWNFYVKPSNIIDSFDIVLNSVETTLKTPDTKLGLEIKITINDQDSTTFIIYGFSDYTAQDYKRIFEAANHSGKITKNGKPFNYLDWKDLTKDPSDPNYFGNYFKPIIPIELSANNIVATPDWFNLLPGNVINYHYILHPSYLKADSPSNGVSISASIPVSSYYEYKYPINTDAYKPVTRNWKPVNFDFIKANLPANFTRAQFDSFIWKHWNGSTLADAVNAVRYWYLFDESNLSSKLSQYSKNLQSLSGKTQIGLLISGGKDVTLNPTYDASTNLNGNNSYVKFNWKLPNFKTNKVIDLLSSFNGWKGPFSFDGSLNIGFDSKKPTAFNKDGLIEIPVNVTTDVYFRNWTYPSIIFKESQVVKKGNWTILDGLYYYFKNSNTLNNSYSTPFFSQFSETLTKQV